MKKIFKGISVILLMCAFAFSGCGVQREPYEWENNSESEANTAAVWETSGAFPDFRCVRWGMTYSEVMAAEGGEPLLALGSEIIYGGLSAAGKNAELRYLFDDDGRLWRGEYMFTERYLGYDECTDDFDDIVRAVSGKYGKPILSEPCRAVWETDNTDICLKLSDSGHSASLVLFYRSKTYERVERDIAEGL